VKTILATILCLLMLAGCAAQQPTSESTLPSQVITVTKPVVIVPNPMLFPCPVLPALPNPKTLTDLQVSRYVVSLYGAASTCSSSWKAENDFLNKAAKAAK